MSLSRHVQAWSRRLLIGLASLLPVMGEDIRVVAITPLELVAIDGVRSDGVRAITAVMEDQLQVQLSDSDQITVVERARIDQILKEQALALSGLVDPATAARVGRLLKADVVVVGRLRLLADKRRMVTLRAIAVTDAQVVWTGDAQGDDGTLAGQAASLGASLATVLRKGTLAPVAFGVIPLRAAKHQERAVALRALGAHEEAATEHLLALHHDPTMADAEQGFLAALVAAGFEGLAAAEAKAVIARTSPPADSPLHDVAARTALPSGKPNEQQDSLSTSSLRRFVQQVERRVREAPTGSGLRARQEEIRAWIMLGDVYVAERRDRRAGEAYQEALTRIWAIRATDPLIAREDYFAFTKICDTAAERCIELAASAPHLLAPNVREALNKRQGLPAGCPPPLWVYHAELPVVDRVLLPNPERNGGNLVLRVQRGNLPSEAVIIKAHIVGLGQSPVALSSVRVVDTAWKGAEATTLFARTGVPWPSLSEFAYDQVLGRTPFVNSGAGPNDFIGVLQECLRRGDQDHGFVAVDFQPRLTSESLHALRVQIEVILPHGVPPKGLSPTGASRVQRAVHLLLAGEHQAARDELVSASGMSLTNEDRNSQRHAQELLTLMPELP